MTQTPLPPGRAMTSHSPPRTTRLPLGTMTGMSCRGTRRRGKSETMPAARTSTARFCCSPDEEMSLLLYFKDNMVSVKITEQHSYMEQGQKSASKIEGESGVWP